MIPKIQARGASFKGLAAYLAHDPKAESEKRVDWTHTLNLAHDHIPSAVNEMYWTARNAELLKQEAGTRAGGRATENPVKHFSLNWSPEDNPTREQMVAATEDFLTHMKWQEHQAILIAHNDKEYAHVHVMLNAIHPETGLRLDESFEKRRAQAWALGYEKENGRTYCEQRLLNAEEREDSPTRPAWMAFRGAQRDFEQAEKARAEDAQENELKNTGKKTARENPENVADFSDWKILKEIQRGERQAFFATGKNEFSDLRRTIYREVREEFREGWGDYYAARREGVEAEKLTAMKEELLAAQKERLDGRRDEACKALREERDGRYQELLGTQKDIRAELRARQEAGLDNGIFLDLIARREPGASLGDTFARAAGETTERAAPPRQAADEAVDDRAASTAREPHHGVKSPGDAGGSLATGLGFGVLAFFDSIADGLTGSRPAPPPRVREDEDRPSASRFDAAVEEAQKRQQQEDRSRDEEEWRKRQRSPYGD